MDAAINSKRQITILTSTVKIADGDADQTGSQLDRGSGGDESTASAYMILIKSSMSIHQLAFSL
jgi:hypothetical protein